MTKKGDYKWSKSNGPSRPYYTLLIRDEFNSKWQIHFGDYDKQTVNDERNDMRASGYLKKDTRIIHTPARQAAIDKAVAELNAQPTEPPFDPPYRIIALTGDTIVEAHNAIADAIGEPHAKLKR